MAPTAGNRHPVVHKCVERPPPAEADRSVIADNRHRRSRRAAVVAALIAPEEGVFGAKVPAGTETATFEYTLGRMEVAGSPRPDGEGADDQPSPRTTGWSGVPSLMAVRPRRLKRHRAPAPKEKGGNKVRRKSGPLNRPSAPASMVRRARIPTFRPNVIHCWRSSARFRSRGGHWASPARPPGGTRRTAGAAATFAPEMLLPIPARNETGRSGRMLEHEHLDIGSRRILDIEEILLIVEVVADARVSPQSRAPVRPQSRRRENVEPPGDRSRQSRPAERHARAQLAPDREGIVPQATAFAPGNRSGTDAV